MQFSAINTADPCADLDEIIAANAFAKLLGAQLEQARRLRNPSKRRNLIQDLYAMWGVNDAQRYRELLSEEAEVFRDWAEEFDHTRHMMQLMGLSDDAIDEYQRQVREAAEMVLRPREERANLCAAIQFSHSVCPYDNPGAVDHGGPYRHPNVCPNAGIEGCPKRR